MSTKENFGCSCREIEETQSIIVNRTDSSFSRAAVKILLDNIAAPEDVESIFKTDSKLKSEAENIGDCEFCNKKCNSCQLCCRNKGMQLYLLNKALERINCIPIRCQGIFCKGKPNAICGDDCKRKTSSPTQRVLKVNSFKNLRSRLENLKKYYPYIYQFKGNIIEEWGKDEMLSKLRREVLNFDGKDSTIFWI